MFKNFSELKIADTFQMVLFPIGICPGVKVKTYELVNGRKINALLTVHGKKRPVFIPANDLVEVNDVVHS